MTSIHIYDPANGSALPELPPLPIGALVVAAQNLMQQAADLPQPVHVTICDTQSITVQFAQVKASLKAITRWALRFGGIAVSESHQTEDGPQIWCRTEFDYYGVTVRAFAHVPADPASS